MTKSLLPTLFALLCVGAAPTPDPAPSPSQLRATVERLVGFGTRHSLSTTTDPERGIGAARNWVASEFQRIGRACGGCITVDRPNGRYEAISAPDGFVVEDVLGIQRGTGDPKHVVVVAGHLDSRASDLADANIDAPGANDDASGVALVLEAARILSREKHRATIVYAALSGEEQCLCGGKLLAQTANYRGWNVAAMLNNDIVGNTVGQDGIVVADRVRIFSQGVREFEDPLAAKIRWSSGGEDDTPSRALAKLAGNITRSLGALEPMVIRRPDRLGRSGDHKPMLQGGFPAIRFSVGVENWDAQHQDVRRADGKVYGDTPDRMDFGYLAKVTAINVQVLRQLAAAPPAPTDVTAGGALSANATVRWRAVPGAAGYRIRWRRADHAEWEQYRDVAATATEATLKGVFIDDSFVAVSAVSADGAESLLSFAGLSRSQLL